MPDYFTRHVVWESSGANVLIFTRKILLMVNIEHVFYQFTIREICIIRHFIWLNKNTRFGG